MKKQLLFTTLIMMGWGAYSQVGIGTLTPQKSSQLDVVSDKKGILIPRVSLQSTKDTVTIDGGNINSLLVFNTASVNDVRPGYYYWYTDRWMRVLNAGDIIDKNTVNKRMDTENGYLVLTDDNGDNVSIPLNKINIITTLVNNNDGTYTYTNEAGVKVIIDVPGDVISNFEQIVTDENVLNQLVENLLETKVGGNVSYDGNQFTYVDSNGDIKFINIRDLVKSNETVTTLRDNGYGTFTYFNESDYDANGNLKPGATGVVFNANTLTITETSGVYTFTDASGAELASIDTNANAIIFNDTVTQLGAADVQTAIEKLVGRKGNLSVSDGLEFTGGTTGTDKLLADAGIGVATQGITADKLGAGTGNEGKVATAHADGSVTYEIPVVDASNISNRADLKAADSSITITNGTGATLVNTDVQVATGGISTAKIADGAVTAPKLNAGAGEEGRVATADAAGNVTYTIPVVDASDVNNAGNLTVSEGIEFYGNTNGTDKLLQDVQIRLADGGITNSKIADGAVTASKMNAEAAPADTVPTATGVAGEVQYKPVPRFFYMPAVIFDTSATANGLQRNLYQDYVNQFTGGVSGDGSTTYDIAHGASGSGMPYTGGLIGSTGAPADIVTYGATEMYYYITYYDTAVFANVSISESGILSYDIIGNVNETSYMNIVFVIK